MASGNAKQVAYIAEVTPGTTPATPQTQLLAIINYEPTRDVEMNEDNSINATGQVMSLNAGNYTASGTLEAHLAPDVLDDFIAAALKTTASASMTVGTALKHFTIEDGYTDLGQYRVARGMTVDNMKISMPNSGYCTATFGLKGHSVSAFTGTSLDSTPTPVVSKTPFSHAGGTFKINGSTVGWIKSIDLEVANNTTSHHCAGSNAVAKVSPGQLRATATVTGLFNDVTDWNNSVNDVTGSLEFTLVSGSESMTFKISSLKAVTQLQNNPNNEVEQVLTLSGFYNATDTSSIKITKV